MRFVRGYRGVDGSIQPRLGFPRSGGYGRYEDARSDSPPPPGPAPSELIFRPPVSLDLLTDVSAYVGIPTHLTASIQVPPGGQGTVNIDALKNLLPDRDIEITEIKFVCKSASQVVFCTGIITCRLSFKMAKNDPGVILTQGYMPIGLFAGYDDGINPLAETTNYVVSSSTPSSGYTVVNVKLPVPIRMPPGSYLEPIVGHLGQTNAAITVFVSAAGRILPGASKGSDIFPYFAFYSTTAAMGVVSTAFSTEQDLVNPFDQPIHVSSLIGRIALFASNLSFFTNASNNACLENIEGLFSIAPTNASTDSTDLIRVGMWTSSGYPMVHPGTAFRTVFDLYTREWLTDFDLDAGEYLIAQIDSLVSRDTPQNFPLNVGIGLRGWREVAR